MARKAAGPSDSGGDSGGEKSKASRAAEAQRKAVEAAVANAQAVNADTNVDKRQKSRNKQFVERVTGFAEMAPPTSHTTETMDQSAQVSEMARASAADGSEARADSVSSPDASLGGLQDEIQENEKKAQSGDSKQSKEPSGNQDAFRDARDDTRLDVASSPMSTGAPEGSGGAFREAKDITRSSVARGESSGQGIESGDGPVADQARQLEQEIIAQVPGVDSPEQVEVVRDGDTLRAELTDSGVLGARRSARETAQRRTRNAMEGLGIEGTPGSGMRGPRSGEQTLRERKQTQRTRNALEGLGIGVAGGAMAGRMTAPSTGELTYRDLERGQAVDKAAAAANTAFRGQRSRAGSGEEQFGDIDWSFGLGGPEDEVESWLEGASDTVTETGRNVANRVFAEETFTGESAGGPALKAAGFPGLAEAYEENTRNVAKGVGQAPFALANVPGLAKTGLEATEYVAEFGSQAAEGNAPEYLDRTGVQSSALAGAAWEQVTENPYRTIGLLAGGLAGSYGLMSTARAVGPKTGALSRALVQPGEEALGYGAYTGLRYVKNAKTAQRWFPNKEPLLFSEEAALSAGRAASKRLSQMEFGTGRVRSAVSEAAARRPRTRVTFDSETGFVDVRPATKTQFLQGVEARTPSTPSPGEFAGRARERVGDASSAARGRVQSSAINAELAAREVKQMVGDIDIRDVSTRARRQARGVLQEAKGRTKGGLLSLEAGAYNARRRLGDIEPSDAVPSRPGFEGFGRPDVSGRARSALLSLEAGTYNARRGLSNIDPSGALPSAPALGGLGESVSGGVKGGLLSLEASAYNARRGVETQLLETGERIKSAPSAVRETVSYEPGLMDPVSGAGTGAYLSARGAANRFLEMDASDLFSPRENRLRDLTIRVEPGRPPRRVSASRFETGDTTEASLLDPSDFDSEGSIELDVDAGGSGSSVVSVEVDAGETGGGQRMVGLQRTETNVDTGATAELETPGSRASGQRRPRIEFAEYGQPEAGVGEVAGGLPAGQNAVGLDSRPQDRAGLDSLQETGMGSEFEFETVLESETGLEVDSGQETRRRVESGVESRERRDVEAEQELELETEVEFESEPSGGDKEKQLWERPETLVGGGGVSSPDNDLGAGYFNEYVTAIALGAGPREVASGSDSGGSVGLTEQRATRAQAEGNADVAAVASALAFSNLGVSVTGDGSGSRSSGDDEWPQIDF